MVEAVAIKQPHDAEYGFTKTCGAFDDCIEHRLRVCRRPADDVNDLDHCGLMFECFGELARALAQFAGEHLNLLFQVDVGVLRTARAAGIGFFHVWLIGAARPGKCHELRAQSRAERRLTDTTPARGCIGVDAWWPSTMTARVRTGLYVVDFLRSRRLALEQSGQSGANAEAILLSARACRKFRRRAPQAHSGI